jgi:hypothetical protein
VLGAEFWMQRRARNLRPTATDLRAESAEKSTAPNQIQLNPAGTGVQLSVSWLDGRAWKKSLRISLPSSYAIAFSS